MRRRFAVVGVALAFGALSWWLIWALWINSASHAPNTDRWLAFMTGVGAMTAAVGVVIGGVWAFLYGRKASVSISAEAHPLASGEIILSARPIVRGAGLFRVRFYGADAAQAVMVCELHLDDSADSGTRLSRDQWGQRAPFGDQHADGGEAVPTTVVFRLWAPAETVVGWMVFLNLRASRRWVPNATQAWGDRVFVARTHPPALTSGPTTVGAEQEAVND